jgi:hypothetical protein
MVFEQSMFCLNEKPLGVKFLLAFWVLEIIENKRKIKTKRLNWQGHRRGMGSCSPSPTPAQADLLRSGARRAESQIRLGLSRVTGQNAGSLAIRWAVYFQHLSKAIQYDIYTVTLSGASCPAGEWPARLLS